ncbi:helix-turn-helix domain-containing protein [Chloroflexi bacterium TSY]|nr:helix-turn-helix domain-containing protein [Chloroflexi bacterium TSY]
MSDNQLGVQIDVNSILGTVRDVTSRSFKELRAHGLIEMGRHAIQIKDRDGLLQSTRGG